MFTIIAEKHNDNTLKFDETFYKHFFYKLLHIKNFDMAHLLYSTMTSISNIEPGIFFFLFIFYPHFHHSILYYIYVYIYVY